MGARLADPAKRFSSWSAVPPARDQFRFLLWWYTIDEEVQRLYLHGVRRLAKGSGKSSFAAVLILIKFCAPVRLRRFDNEGAHRRRHCRSG